MSTARIRMVLPHVGSELVPVEEVAYRQAKGWVVDTSGPAPTADRGGGQGVVPIGNAATVPASNPAAGGVLYAEGGALKWRGSNGTVTTIAPA